MNCTSATVIPEPGGIAILAESLIPRIPDMSWAWANARDEPASNRAERASPQAADLAITKGSFEYLSFMNRRTSPGVEKHSTLVAQPHNPRNDLNSTAKRNPAERGSPLIPQNALILSQKLGTIE